MLSSLIFSLGYFLIFTARVFLALPASHMLGSSCFYFPLKTKYLLICMAFLSVTCRLLKWASLIHSYLFLILELNYLALGSYTWHPLKFIKSSFMAKIWPNFEKVPRVPEDNEQSAAMCRFLTPQLGPVCWWCTGSLLRPQSFSVCFLWPLLRSGSGIRGRDRIFWHGNNRNKAKPNVVNKTSNAL